MSQFKRKSSQKLTSDCPSASTDISIYCIWGQPFYQTPNTYPWQFAKETLNKWWIKFQGLLVSHSSEAWMSIVPVKRVFDLWLDSLIKIL